MIFLEHKIFAASVGTAARATEQKGTNSMLLIVDTDHSVRVTETNKIHWVQFACR
jgi:hypothetical protein